MKISPVFSSLGLMALPAGALMAMLTGCESLTEQREHTLAAAGFRTVIPSNDRQRQQLASLPPDKVTPLRHGSQTVFIFPDPKRDMLYVGRDANYQRYRELRLQQNIAQENLAAAQMWTDPGWGTWGPWPGYWWY